MVSILHREMRIASRRPWTFRIRIITSVVAFFAGIGLTVMGSFQSRMNGNYLFSTLIFFSFWFCLIQGVRKASASISEEKRDGTLGLLFLTDLRPIDIIGGKLFSVAIPLVQPLLAFVPVLSISILLGGTTGGEVFRAALVLASILLYSISAGLFVSSFSRKSEETGHGTLILLIASLAVPRMLAWAPPLLSIRFLSPWTAFQNISDPGYRVTGNEFWWSWGAMNVLSALLLVGAAFFLKRRWEDKPVMAPKKMASASKAQMSAIKRAKLLDRNPGEWLAARHGGSGVGNWFFRIITIALAGLTVFVSVSLGEIGPGIGLLYVATLLIVIRIASQSSYALAETRRSGAIEMLLSTPFNPQRLISGQIAALRTQFLPFIGLLMLTAVGIAVWVSYNKNSIGGFAGSTVLVAMFCVVLLLVSSTVAALGMWMGLREKSPNAAFFKTIAIALVLPMFSSCFWIFAIVIWPLSYLGLLIFAISRLRGKPLERLLRNEGKKREMTPVTPLVGAPPIIKPQG